LSGAAKGFKDRAFSGSVVSWCETRDDALLAMRVLRLAIGVWDLILRSVAKAMRLEG
jgi:hypothetical protein